MPLSVGSMYVVIALPVVLSSFCTLGVVVPFASDGNQPHSSALLLPVSSGQPDTVPTVCAVNALVSSFASVALVPMLTSAPPATNSVSVVPPAVSVEKPMPNWVSPFCECQPVAVH